MEMKKNILMKKYEVGRMLGQGAFGKVYYGRNIISGKSVAMKVINKEKVVKTGLMNHIKREIYIMNMVRHQNIMHLEEVMATKTKIYFVMEYAKGGELFNKVLKGRLKENIARKYFQQLICALSFCHKRGVYHRDLKPENLLLDENEDLKVSDFGLSALSESKRQDGLLHTTCGTPAYVAPEVISRKGYDGAKADIWSCGVILFVLIAGYLPFHDRNLMEMYRKIAKGSYKSPRWFPPELRSLLSRILDPNPKTRISIACIMENPWFRQGFDIKPPKVVDVHVEEPIFEFGTIPHNLTAFHIISRFDLSGLFVSNDHKDDFQFTSTTSASSIVSKIEDVARDLSFKLTNKNKGYFLLQGVSEGTEGPLSIAIQICKIRPSFHLVEIKKSSGDMIDYQYLLRQHIGPACMVLAERTNFMRSV